MKYFLLGVALKSSSSTSAEEAAEILAKVGPARVFSVFGIIFGCIVVLFLLAVVLKAFMEDRWLR